MKNSNIIFQPTYKSLRPGKGKDMGVSLDLVKRVPESGPDTNFVGKYRAALITLLQAFLIVKFFFLFIIYIKLDVLDSLAEVKKDRFCHICNSCQDKQSIQILNQVAA